MHARYFSSNLGRFLSVDPVGGAVGSSQSWNRYSYVRNNPIKLVDPDGRKEDDDKQQPTLADLEDSIRAVLQGFFGNQVMLIDPDYTRRSRSAAGLMLRVAEIEQEIGQITGPAPEVDRREARSIEEPSSFEGATYDEVVEAIPEGWEVNPARTDDGVRYSNLERKGEQVRIMRGDPTNPDPRKRGPYMRVSSSGKVSDPIPLAGNPALDRNDP